MDKADLLGPGNSVVVRYQIWYPNHDESQNNVMGEELQWDLAIEGRTN